MTAARRQRDSLAPSLFPFLAVLLCTMGALVLILMLIVAGAQASTKSAAAETKRQIEDSEALLEMAKAAYEKQLTEGRIALEKKRLVLQHLETHIQELLTELEDLKRTSELIAEQDSTKTHAAAEHEAAMSELERQLAEAKAELNQKVEKPTGDKPIFAIIPYQGNNGTHRRPIYVECTAEGVTIQPEGVRLLANDLRPPYGPGNPLDAALRTVRAEFPPSNGAVTSTAYPLLVVRPSGIQSYVLARAAMSGWDDQFGYELIDEELELAFPETTPGLKNKLTKAIDLARDRQAALVMAMPKQYRGYAATNASGFDGEWGESESQFAGSASTGSGLAESNSNSSIAGATAERGGFNFDNSASSRLSESGRNSISSAAKDSPYGGMNNNGTMGFAGSAPSGTNGSNSLLDLEQSKIGNLSQSGSSPPSSTGDGYNTAMNGNGATNSSETGGESTDSDHSAMAGTGSSGTGSSGTGSNGTGSSGTGQGGTGSGGTGGNSPTPSAQSNGQSAELNSANESSQSPNGSPPSLSFNQQLNRSNQQEATRPVAASRGRNWAWSQGPPTDTPVVRSIRMQCLNDRWIILPETGSSKEPLSVTFEVSPRVRAEQLAKIVAERVESWGIALTNGHWKPVLLVDVAADAEWRFVQLQQLLDGSGLEVQRRVLK